MAARSDDCRIKQAFILLGDEFSQAFIAYIPTKRFFINDSEYHDIWHTWAGGLPNDNFANSVGKRIKSSSGHLGATVSKCADEFCSTNLGNFLTEKHDHIRHRYLRIYNLQHVRYTFISV